MCVASGEESLRRRIDCLRRRDWDVQGLKRALVSFDFWFSGAEPDFSALIQLWRATCGQVTVRAATSETA